MCADKEYMPDDMFQEMLHGVGKMVAIEKGESQPDTGAVHQWAMVNVKQLRKSTNTTQSQFAQLLGVGVDTVKSWESGRRYPSGSAAKLLTLLSKNPQERALELAQI